MRARELADAAIEHFEDAELGGFFTVASDHEQLLVRRKDIEDNPDPQRELGDRARAAATGRAHR